MLVSPRPGQRRDTILQALTDGRNGISTIQSAINSDKAHTEYIRWASNTARALAPLVSDHDVDRLVLTRRHWLIANSPHPGAQSTLVIINVELSERTSAFESAIDALRHRATNRRADIVLILDTSVFIEHPNKFDEIDFAAAAGADSTRNAHLIIPIVVIDELDNLKKASRDHRRWRAMYSLGVLDKLFASGTDGVRALREPKLRPVGQGYAAPGGEVTIELMFDPQDHLRLPINDDEIVDRALAIQGLSDQQVTLLTFDTNQSLRARAAGLREVKLRNPKDDEELTLGDPRDTAKAKHAKPVR